MAHDHNDTIAALATPSGESAIALIRVSGPAAPQLVESIFGRPPLPRLARHADYRDAEGRVVDDVLYTFFAAPNSYTGEDSLEISCHGSPFVSQRVLSDLLTRGCRSAEPGEFTKRAFLGGRMDLSQAEAVMDLIHARSERALEAANRQLRGALGKHIAASIERLVEIVALVEAYIDFPEEDLPTEDRNRLLQMVETLQKDLGRLLATAHYGALIRDGVRTVILGEPNAGKSSLLNRLLGWDRALVSPEPGTTRDYLEEPHVLGAHKLRFIDTAGLNPSPGEIERRGIERTLERAAEADLFLLVLDVSRPLPSLPEMITSRMTPANTVVAWNKIDLGSTEAADTPWTSFPQVATSARDGTGIDKLECTLSQLIDRERVEIDGDLIAINARHASDLTDAEACLDAARAKLATGAADELMAADLRGVLDALGRIGGRVDHERILDRLFSSFCIGK